MLILIIAFISAFIIASISIPAIIKLARIKHLYDEPSEIKKHAAKIPTLGGIAIFAGIIIATSFFLDLTQDFIHYGALISAMVILFFTGIKDDIIPLSPSKKFLAQLLAVSIIIFKGDIRLTSLYGFLGIYDIHYNFSVLISLLTIIFIINAFNLLDGINGLAGGIACIACFTFGVWFYQHNHINLALFAFSTCGALIGFLRYNLINVKIFMGDTGSLIIGFVSAIFAIKFIELNKFSATEVLLREKAPIFAIVVLILPLFDAFRLFTIRILKGKSPFEGDRNHLHHYLVDIGLTHFQASILMYITNLFFIGLGLILLNVKPLYFLLIIFTAALVLSQTLFLIKTKIYTLRHAKAINKS